MRAVPRETAVDLAPGAVAPRLGARAPRRLAVVAAALALAAAIAVGALALGGSGTAERSLPVGQVLLAGKPLQSANCHAWWAAPEGERMAAIQALTRAIGGPTTNGGRGTTLPDGRVHRLFDRVCTPSFTGHFLLYEIYNRAAGFKSLGG